MNKLEMMFNEWRKLQLLKPEDIKRLNDKFNLEFNFNSNHIEGNTLTYGQTKMLLIFGESVGDAKMRDLEEMKAHNAGLRWIREVAKDQDYRITERDLRNLNHIILAEDFYKVDLNGNRYQVHVGIYKTRPNSVITATGEEFSYASPQETPMMMYELIQWLNEELDKQELSPIELAALMHYRYIRIHPFEDGNGRIARLLITYILERSGYPMLIIKSAHKEEYLRVLHQCDVEVGMTPSDGANASVEDIKPFVKYLEREAEWSLSMAIKAAKGESIEESDDWRKRLKTRFSSKIGAPERTDTLIEQAETQSYNPLIEYINNELTEFYPLFDSSDISLFNQDIFDSTIKSSTIRLNTNNYTITVELIFTPNQYKYSITAKIDSERTLIKEYRYDQMLLKEDFIEILDFIGRILEEKLSKE